MAEEQQIDLKGLFDRTQEHVKAFSEFSKMPFLWLKEVLEEVRTLTDPKNSLLPQTPCMKRMRRRKLPLISETEELPGNKSDTRNSKDAVTDVLEDKLTTLKRLPKRTASSKATEKITLSLEQEKIDPSKKSNRCKIMNLSNGVGLAKMPIKAVNQTPQQNEEISCLTTKTASDLSSSKSRCLRPRNKKSGTKTMVLRSKAKKSVVKTSNKEMPKTPQEARMMLRHIHKEKSKGPPNHEIISPFQSVKNRVDEYTKRMTCSPVSDKMTLRSKKPTINVLATPLKSLGSKNNAYSSNDSKTRNVIHQNTLVPEQVTPNTSNASLKVNRLSKTELSSKKSIRPSVSSLRLSSHLAVIKASKMSETQRRSSLMRHRLYISREYLARTNTLSTTCKKKCSVLPVPKLSSSSSTSLHDSGKNTTQEEIDDELDPEQNNCSLVKQNKSQSSKTQKRPAHLMESQEDNSAKLLKLTKGRSLSLSRSHKESLHEVSRKSTETIIASEDFEPALLEKQIKDEIHCQEISIHKLPKAIIIVPEQEQKICQEFIENSLQIKESHTDKSYVTPLKTSRFRSISSTSSDTDDKESCIQNTPIPSEKLFLASGYQSEEKSRCVAFHFISEQKTNGTYSTCSTGKAHQNHVTRLGLKAISSASKIASSHSVCRLGQSNLLSTMNMLMKSRPPSRELSNKEIERQRLNEISKKLQHEEEILKKRNKLLEMKVQEQKKRREERMQKAAEARRKMEQEKEDREKLRTQSREEKLAKTEQEREERLREEVVMKKQMWQRKKAEVDERRRQEEEIRHAKLLEQEENEKQRIVQSEKQKKECERLKEETEKQRIAQAEKQKKECERLKAILLSNNNYLVKVPPVNSGQMKLNNHSSKQLPLKTTPLHLPSSSATQLNNTYNKENNFESYELTPHRPVRSSCYNYDISDLKSDDESEDECTPQKPIPGWAQGIRLKETLILQYYNPPDLDILFGSIPRLNLENMFLMKKKKYFQRTSSAVWASSPMKFI